MNKDEMFEDKKQMARIIAFELCPQKYHKEWYGEYANCYADDNFADCATIKEVVDKLINAGYRKVGKDEIVIKKSEYEKLRLAKYKAMEEAIEYEKTAYKQLEQAKQETAREILITIHNNLKYATIKQTGTLISIKSLANELGIDLED